MNSATSAETAVPETRTGLPPFTRAEMPVPPFPKGSRVDRRLRPRRHRARRLDRQRRIPARSRGVRAARPVAPVGDEHRRVPPGDLQHRADAIHASRPASRSSPASCAPGPARAGGRRSTRCSSSCRSAGPRGRRPPQARCSSSPIGQTRGARKTRRRSTHRHRDLRRHRRRAARRQAHRAHARDPQLDPGHRDHRLVPRARADLRARQDVARRGHRLRGLRPRQPPLHLPAGRHGFLPARRARRLLRLRRHAQHRAVELGARQGLRHGEPRGLHLRRRRRRESRAGAHGIHLHAGRGVAAAAGAAGGASCAPISGACSSSARYWAWCCPRCCT